MTYASVRSAAEHIARVGKITPQQLAAFSGLDEGLAEAQRQAFTDLWRAEGSPAVKVQQEPSTQNLQSWFSYFTSAQVEQESKGKIRPLTPAEACGFIGCIIVETGRPNLDRLDVIEAGSGAGRGAMQYTGVRRTAYDKARSAAIAKGVDPNSNRWQQQYFAEEYAGLHDPAAGSLIGWTRIFENRPAGMAPAQAAEYWTGSAATATGYFRPGVPHLDRRQKEAQRVWGLVQAGALKPAAKPAAKPAVDHRHVLLNVPYEAQNDNASGTGYRECFSSSAAMVARYYGKIANDDAYNKFRAKYGDTTDSTAQVSALKALGLNARFITNCTAAQLEAELNAGRPVLVGWLHKGPVAAPAGGGHWTCVVGHTPTAFIHNDPNGQANLVAGGYVNTSKGKNVAYSRANWLKRWLVEGPNSGWAVLVSR
jgi:hypothetical protein